MSASSIPQVFISYKWQPEEVKARAFELAEKLRKLGFDSRIDMYFKDSHYSFSPPTRQLSDPRDPWIGWAEREISTADCVLLLCTASYADTATSHSWLNWHELPEHDKRTRKVPYVWWDWEAMVREINAQGPGKFIPIGFGPYESNAAHVPVFLQGETYYNLDSQSDFEGLTRRLRAEYRKRHPRSGVFVSYAHDDDPKWIDMLLRNLRSLKRSGVEIWTDQEIKPGQFWHQQIQEALGRAKVAVLLVSQNFLDSSYILSDELPEMLRAAKSEGLTIFWIPVKPSKWQESPIAAFQSAHTPPTKPLATLRGAALDQAFLDIASKLEHAVGV